MFRYIRRKPYHLQRILPLLYRRLAISSSFENGVLVRRNPARAPWKPGARHVGGDVYRRITLCQGLSSTTGQCHLLSTDCREKNKFPEDKYQKRSSIQLTEEEERFWIARIDSQTAEDADDIIHILRENGRKKLIRRIRKLLERPIFLPEKEKDEGKAESKTNTECPTPSSPLSADVKAQLDEDFSAWVDFLAEAEVIDNPRRRLTWQRNWKVRRGVQHSLSLLRVLSNKEWKSIDSTLEEGTHSMRLENFVKDTVISTGEETGTISNDEEPETDLTEEEDTDTTDVYSYDDIEKFLGLVSEGGLELSTANLNLLLARASIALDLSPVECHEMVLAITNVMRETNVSPDQITLEILIRAVSDRVGYPHTAIEYVDQLIKDSSLRSPDTLRAAFHLCETLKDFDLALKLWKCYLENDSFRMPVDALISYMSTLKASFAQEEAIDVMQFSLKQNQNEINKRLDNLFEVVCIWPVRNRDGSQDNTRILEAALELLSDETLYMPSHFVWSNLMTAASKHSQNDERRIRVVYCALVELLQRFPAYHPDERMIKISLDALQAMDDPGLALDLLARRMTNVLHHRLKDEGSAPSKAGDVSAEEYKIGNDTARIGQKRLQSERVSSDEVHRILSNCVESGAMDAVHSVLSLVEEFEHSFHPTLFPQVCSIAIRAFVGRGELQLAKNVVQRLQARGHEPSEEDFGNIMHGHIVSDDRQSAEELFESLESGTMGDIRPGPTCFNSIFLGCIKDRRWEDALSWYDRMIEAGMQPLAPSYAGLLLASFKVGGQQQTLSMIDQLSANGARISSETVRLALKLLLPGFEEDETFADIRRRMRYMIDQRREPSSDPFLNLLRAIREAEMQDEEEVNLPAGSLPRGDGWCAVLPLLISAVESRDAQNSGNAL